MEKEQEALLRRRRDPFRVLVWSPCYTVAAVKERGVTILVHFERLLLEIPELFFLCEGTLERPFFAPWIYSVLCITECEKKSDMKTV